MARPRLARMVLGAVAAGAPALLVATIGADALPARADAFSAFAVVNGTTTAAADHESVGTSSFPNFSKGVVDNYYPLAHAHIDNSPFSEGTASPLDTGPLGVTVLGTQGLAPPQYAEQRYPPQASAPATFGAPGGPYAVAVAGPTGASAMATAASMPPPSATPGGGIASSPPVGAGTNARLAWVDALAAALDGWRRASFTAEWNAAHPMVQPDAAQPDGSDGDTAATSVAVDPGRGLAVSGDSRVSRASFGGGLIVIDGVRVSVSIANDGTKDPTPQIAIDVGSTSVAGVPVSIGAQGVSVVGQQVATLEPLQQINSQLDAILQQAGITVSTVAPSVTRSAHQVTVDAIGVRVDVVQPSVPGVPTQVAHHVLAEVFADSLAERASVVGNPTLGPSTAAPEGGSSGTGTVETFSGSEGATAVGAAAPSPETAPAGPSRGATGVAGIPTIRAVAAKPLWLLLLYFAWQSLVLGTAASLWWWRRGLPRTR